jgi:nucleotide-binding universal stress UspA family protein
MNRIVAALDNSLAAGPVLTVARALAPLLDCAVDALHLTDGGDWIAAQVAQAAGVRLRHIRGPRVGALVEAGQAADVAALVVGARATPAGRRPLGSTALAVATELTKPVVVVPPDATVAATIRRLLVPVEGGLPAGTPPGPVGDLARGADLELIALHVYLEPALPLFTDQPQHETEARAREFVRRYCHWCPGPVRLETRVGRAEDVVPAVADEVDADLVVLAWCRELGPGHAPVVRAVLERCRRPVLLVPA